MKQTDYFSLTLCPLPPFLLLYSSSTTSHIMVSIYPRRNPRNNRRNSAVNINPATLTGQKSSEPVSRSLLVSFSASDGPEALQNRSQIRSSGFPASRNATDPAHIIFPSTLWYIDSDPSTTTVTDGSNVLRINVGLVWALKHCVATGDTDSHGLHVYGIQLTAGTTKMTPK